MENFTPEERERVAEENYNLIFAKVSQFRNTPVPEEELISAAHVGFAKALNNFDKTAGFQFSTFAYRSMHLEIIDLLRYERTRSEIRRFKSLDFEIKSFGMESLYSFIGAKEDGYYIIESESSINSAIKRLTEREKIVFESMLDRKKSKMNKELGISRQHLSRIVKSIREKFREELER